MKNTLELPLKKYPYNGKSKYLFDKIMIIGYTPSFMNKNTPSDNLMTSRITEFSNSTKEKEEINKPTEKNQLGLSPTKLQSKSGFQNKYSNASKETKIIQMIELPEYPIVLGDISSDYSKQFITNDTIISLIFPSLPKITKINVGKENKDEDNVVFSFNPISDSSKISTNGYGFIYYEIYKGYSYPKVIFFLSEYPYFSSFRDLGINISQSVNSIYPLEYILYNIINYTPSPINFSVNLQPFSYNTPPSFFPQLTCYPLFNFDLSELFNVLPYEIIVELFFFSLLENDIIFFSKNNETLTIIMYIFSNLNYPCNDSTYYWQILSVSQFTFLNDASPFVSKTCSCMTGINASYDSSIPTTSKIKEHFVVDLDNKTLDYKYNEDKANLDEVANTRRLQDYIKRAIRGKCNQNDRLAQAILLFYKDLKVLGDKITHINTGKSKFFKQMTKIIEDHNKIIQNAFYLFMIQILKIYSRNYSLSNVSDRDSNSNNSNQSLFYISLTNKMNLKPDELLFYDKFLQCAKYNQFMISFIKYQDCIDLFKIPLIMTEELIYWLNIKNDIRLIFCLDLMDKLYLNNVMLHVNFKAFYQEFNENKIMLPQMKKQSSSKTKNKPLEINVKNLLPYNYLISNMDNKEKEILFPSFLKFQDNFIQTTTFLQIQNEIEKKLMEQNEISSKDLVSNCIMLVFGLTREVCESNSLNQIYWFKMGFTSDKINMRKYYSMLLSICLRLTNKNKEFSMQQFYLIINSLRDNLNIIPNEELLILMNQVGLDINLALPNITEYNEPKEYILEQEFISDKEKVIDNNRNTVIRNILGSGEVRNWEKNIKISFKDKEIKPYLNIAFDKQIHKSIKASKVYSLTKLYNKSNEIMNNYYQSLDLKKNNSKRLNDIILNLLLYIHNIQSHSIEKKNNLIQLLLNILLLVNFNEDKSVMKTSLFTLQVTLY